MNTTSITAASRPSKGLHIILWILQVLLAGFFAMAGFMKLTTPIETMAAQAPWVLNAPSLLIRFIGLSEVLGALGLLIPSLTRIKPKLTVLAAYGLALVMVLAALFHMSRKEYSAIPINILVAGVALFIAWGRSKKAPIPDRQEKIAS
ncbi:MAG: DoxX family protein [Chitinophagaceae bacterium]